MAYIMYIMKKIVIIVSIILRINCDITNSAIDDNFFKARQKRSDDDASALIICDGGHFNAICPKDSSVNVTEADYGRMSEENICAKTGLTAKNGKCRSRDALKRIREFCKAKNLCSMKVDADTLGRPVTSDGSSCYDTSKYLKMVYTCLTDCKRPTFRYNMESTGDEYHVGSKVTLRCRAGYESVGGMPQSVEKECAERKGWIGPSLLCQDVDECENPSTNDCHRFAECQNTRGSYSCTCIEGYHGDGITCTSDSWFKDDDWLMEGGSDSAHEEDAWDTALIEVHDEKVCGKRIIRSRQGTIRSPGNPESYPQFASCTWIITVPLELIVELRFMSFDLERMERNAGCSYDNVTLYDGLNRDPKWWLGTFCGDVTPPPIKSQTNQIRIEFRSNGVAEFKGFEARFYAVDLNNACLNFPAASYRGIVVVDGARNSTTEPRKSLTLGCRDGYTSTSQSLVRTCTDDGKWDDNSNPCTPVSCGIPYTPSDAVGLVVNAEISRFRYDELPVRYECRTGYRMHVDEGTDAVIVCDKKGKWSNSKLGTVPWCEKITCTCHSEVSCDADDGGSAPHRALRWIVTDPDGKEISQPVGQALAYGSKIKYSCESGFSLSSDGVRSCAENGWSGRSATCEKASTAGLSNYHIAIIASASSGLVILLIGIALVICCCRDHKKKAKKRKQMRQRRMRAARDNDGFILNMTLAGNDDFLYGNTIDRRDRNNGFAGRHNDIRKYQTRQHVLPGSATSGFTPSPTRNYYNGEIRTNQTSRSQENAKPTRKVNQPRSGSNVRSTSVTKMSIKAPPPGYLDPPPSYDTMVREGYSVKSGNKKSKR